MEDEEEESKGETGEEGEEVWDAAEGLRPVGKNRLGFDVWLSQANFCLFVCLFLCLCECK